MLSCWCCHGRGAFSCAFYFGDTTANFLRGHNEAFSEFSGVPREILFDNLKSAVLERVGNAIHFNPNLLALSAHYRFAPKPVAVARPTSKGRVERSIQYIRSSFFAARRFQSLEDLNEQAEKWCREEALQRRCPQDQRITVAEAFEQEKPRLLPLPSEPFPVVDRKIVHIAKVPYAKFDLNEYSIPHQFANRQLVVEATLDTVSISDGLKVIATHKRSFDKGIVIESQEHVDRLVSMKKEASKHRAIDRLKIVVPSSIEYFLRAAERGHNLGRLTQLLTRWLDLYGACELESAIATILARGTFHSSAILTILDKSRESKGLRTPVPLHFARKNIGDISVTPRGLEKYDNLTHKEQRV